MNKLVLALLLAASSAPVLAATPAIPERADAPPRFVPDGWRVETQLESDFNADGKVDIAMIVRNDDARWLLVAVGSTLDDKGEYRFSKEARSTVPKDKLYLETAPLPEDTVEAE